MNIKRLLLIKENQISQVKEFSSFLCRVRWKILGLLKSFPLLQEGGAPARVQEWALFKHSEMNFLRTYMCWQSKRLYWKGVPAWRAIGQGNPGELLCHAAHSLKFHGDRVSLQVVFGQSFWLRALPGSTRLHSQDGCQWEGFWETVGHMVSPFDFAQTLPVSGGLLVPCSLLGPPAIKKAYASGCYGAWPGWVVLVNMLPLTLAYESQLSGSQHPVMWFFTSLSSLSL